ncbi:MAG: DNA uptake protein ComE-like DNA-binding protein [Cyclobacteriaceae bacterium]|jgi:competence protein ComEA
MFKKIRIFIIDQLGFSLTEANGTIVLSFIILSIIFLPILHEKLILQDTLATSDLAEMEKWYDSLTTTIKKKPEEISKIKFEFFDPNNISSSKWISFGIESRIADRIINFRNAGGSFRKSEDLYKIYGIDSSTVSDLLPYALINSISKEKASKNYSKSKQDEDDKNYYEAQSAKSWIKIDLNEASAQELTKIYGIGKRLSERIIKYRGALGGYYSEKQLFQIYNLEDSVIYKISESFVIDSTNIKTLSINGDSINQLARHPYINYNLARAIINYRINHGDYVSISDLKQVKIMNDSIFELLLPYLSTKSDD